MPTATISHRPPRSWLKISILAAPEQSEIIAAYLAALTEAGVEHIGAAAAAHAKSQETIIGYLADGPGRPAKEAELNAFLENIARQFPDAPCPALQQEFIHEEDWHLGWKKHFKPCPVTPRLTIKPSWENYTPAQHETVIEMDPGMAFGTGHHASTRLAMEFIDALFAADNSLPVNVLDVGTGTGILAIACALLGASQVTAIDNDPDAVAAARENVEKTQLAGTVTVSAKALSDLAASFDLITANITHDVLIELAPAILPLLRNKGHLILAGILKGEQERSILASYTAMGFRPAGVRTHQEWAAIHFIKMV